MEGNEEKEASARVKVMSIFAMGAMVRNNAKTLCRDTRLPSLDDATKSMQSICVRRAPSSLECSQIRTPKACGERFFFEASLPPSEQCAKTPCQELGSDNKTANGNPRVLQKQKFHVLCESAALPWDLCQPKYGASFKADQHTVLYLTRPLQRAALSFAVLSRGKPEAVPRMP